MPYATPISESQASGGYAPERINIVDEATLLSSNVAVDRLNNIDSDDDDDCEAIVRLDARPAPKKSIDIDTQLSDQTVATTEGDKNRITHYILGHSSHKKMVATSAVVDGMPKYSKFNTWCTSCQKGKMHVKPHAQNLWQERTEHKK